MVSGHQDVASLVGRPYQDGTSLGRGKAVKFLLTVVSTPTCIA